MRSVVRAIEIGSLFLAAAVLSAFGSLYEAVLVAAVAFALGALFPVNPVPRRTISLEAVALGALGAYTLSVPIHHLAYHDYRPDAVQFAFVLCMVAAAGFVVGNVLQRCHARAHTPASVPVSVDWQKYYRIGWIIFLLGVLSAAVAVAATVGFRAYLTAGYAGRSVLKREAGPVELGLYHAVLGLVIVNLSRMRDPNLRRRKWLLALVTSIGLAFVVYVSFLGIRRPSFFLVLAMAMLYGIAGKGYSRVGLGLTVAPAMLMFAMFANFRQVLSDQGLQAAWSFVGANFSFKWFDLSTSELGAPFRVLLDVTQGWRGDPFRMGTTFAETIAYVLPSALRIPVMSLSQEYTVRNFSSDYIAIGGNMGFFPVAEGYLNFGIVGVGAYFVLIGYVVSRIQWRAIHHASPMDLVGFAIAGPWFIFFLRTDMASYAKVFVYSIAVPYLLAIILKAVWRRRRTVRLPLAGGGPVPPVLRSRLAQHVTEFDVDANAMTESRY
jgi:hypothetical protein